MGDVSELHVYEGAGELFLTFIHVFMYFLELYIVFYREKEGGNGFLGAGVRGRCVGSISLQYICNTDVLSSSTFNIYFLYLHMKF